MPKLSILPSAVAANLLTLCTGQPVDCLPFLVVFDLGQNLTHRTEEIILSLCIGLILNKVLGGQSKFMNFCNRNGFCNEGKEKLFLNMIPVLVVHQHFLAFSPAACSEILVEKSSCMCCLLFKMEDI